MEDKFKNEEEISRLINGAFSHTPLRNKFEERLSALNITQNQAVENLQIEYRTLYGILDGTLKRLEILSLLKIAQFLEISYTEIAELYVKSVTDKHGEDLDKSKKRTFILSNFDLPSLRSLGVIESIRDFDHIEQKLNSIFGLSSITDYNIDDVGAAFSEGKIKPKNLNNRKYFIRKSDTIFKLINNPNKYERQRLVEYFAKVRWHSLDIERGLVDVIKALFDLGITVIFQPKMPALQLRGATFAVNKKPCIVLTDYKGFYPTLWFALIHELFHVLFDWEEILINKYHLSEEENDLFTVQQKEDEANEFARDFLFPKSKMEQIGDRVLENLFVREFAIDNHVHPSIVYAIYAYENKNEANYWPTFQKYMPPIKGLLRKLGNDLGHTAKASDFANFYKEHIFNKD